jgi:hypothetical protein
VTERRTVRWPDLHVKVPLAPETISARLQRGLLTRL